MSSLFTVRPSNSEKASFRVNLTAASLMLVKLRPGDLCLLCLPGESTSHRVAIAWENSSNGMKDTVIQTTRLLQDLYGLKLGDRVTVQRSSEKLHDVSQVILQSKEPLSDEEKAVWAFVAAGFIHLNDILAPSQKIRLETGSIKREFEVTHVGGLLGRVNQNTTFAIVDPRPQPQEVLKLDFPMVGGLEKEIEEIRSFVRLRYDPLGPSICPNLLPVRGLILFGAKGTGKTSLLTALANCNWSNVVEWRPGVSVNSTDGKQLVTIEFNGVPMNQETFWEIEALFKSIQETSTTVVAAVRDPNDISDRLLTQDTFAVELEIPIPDVDQRLDILTVLRGDIKQLDDTTLSSLAKKTHGFVGEDLRKIFRVIMHSAFDRHSKHSSGQISGKQPSDNKDVILITSADVERGLRLVRPSALRAVFLEKSNVRWSDIGGQHDLKEKLQDAVELPLKYPDRMRQLGVRPIKGVLLYGPPGCSKTLIAKALANEVDYNFLAVGAAELISMYVGESERATREVFRKARQASPSIIFFDEIDAIAAHRPKGDSNLHVVTTLLNEMDGFRELQNVMVVAATNKPEIIDPALLRPGRFDNVVYVGPPNLDARKEIFDNQFANSSAMEEVIGRTMEFAHKTDGFSGAEITGICNAARWRAIRSGRNVITPEQVLQSISETPKSITPEMLRSYEEWAAQRMR